jgi:hypothetical protein
MKLSIEKDETTKFYQTDADLELRQITKSRMQSRQVQRILEGFTAKNTFVRTAALACGNPLA